MSNNTNPSPAVHQRCAAQHMGPWAVYGPWFQQAVAAVRNGTFKAEQRSATEISAASSDGVIVEKGADGETHVLYVRENSIARIPMFGQVVKGDSSFGGFSSVRARRAIRLAKADEEVDAIVLHIDSPGGTVSGTADLADEVYEAKKTVPVYAYCEDTCASAAYWIASQCTRVYANPTAQVGSIGTMTYVEDTSGMYEKAGIKVTLIATGKFKGQWIDGNPVSDEYIQTVRTEVEDLNEHFLAGVMRGRGMSREALEAIADGRCFIAEKAKLNGLIDEIAPLGAVMQAITDEVIMNEEQFTAYMAEHPEAMTKHTAKARSEGKAEGSGEERARTIGVLTAYGLDKHPACTSIRSGHDVETATVIATTAAEAKAQAEATAKAEADKQAAALAAKDAEIKRLQFEAQGQKAIGMSGQKSTEQAEVDPKDHKAVASAEWDNDEKVRAGFSSKDRYVAVRSAELSGKLKISSK